MKRTLFISLFVTLFSFGLSVGAFACDFTPSVNAYNIVDNNNGTYDIDILVCIGEKGSENGPMIYLNNGISIIATSASELISYTNGNIATGSITGGVLTYDFDDPEFWEPINDEFGPCYSITITVDSDPTGAILTIENINDACLNDISGGVWSSEVLAGGDCTADESLVAPVNVSGNTFGAGNDCDLRDSPDLTYEIEILCGGVYTFSTCEQANWDTYLYLTVDCCSGVIIENDDLCGAQSSITAFLPEGTYYLTVEGFYDFNDGDFTIEITQGEPPYRAQTGPDQEICDDHTIITANDPIFGTGEWSVYTGDGEIVDPTNPTSEVTNLSNGINQFIWTLGEAPCAISTDTITVIAGGNLIIECASDVSVIAEPGECSAVVIYDSPVASSECSSVTISQIGGIGSGGEFPVGTTIETYLVEDTLGNTDSCFVAITVIDDEVPIITCPDDIEVENTPGMCSAIVSFTEPIGTDNCPGATTELLSGIASGEEFPIGTTTNTYQVTDASGNTNFCTFNITVLDTEEPTFDLCPDDIEVDIDEGECVAVVNYDLPEMSDNCAGTITLTLVEGLASGSTFPVGSTTIVYEAEDDAGNIATCSFTVTVAEPVLPEIICPADIEVNVDPDECGAIVAYLPPTGTDNCLVAETNLIEGLAPGEFFPVGVTTIVYEVVDASGNSATCSFTVTVVDNIDPIINCPPDIVADNDPGECGAIVNFSTPTGSDNCDFTISLVSPLGPGDFFPVGNTTVSYMIEDDAGNISTCSFMVTVNDIEAPQPECIDVVVENDPGECFAVVNYDLPSATDNCDDSEIVVTLISGEGSGGTFSVGTHEEVYSIADASGNTNFCTITITVEDAENPEVICPTDIEVNVDPDECGAIVAYLPPTGTDNCLVAETNLIEGLAPGEFFPVGVTTIVYEVVDASGNSATCSFTVTVVDNIDPIINCPPDIVADNDPGECGAIVNFSTPTGSDNCDFTISLVSPLGPGDFFPVGNTTVSYMIEDDAGNISTCSFMVTVNDIEAPQPECIDVVVENDPGECFAVVNYDLPSATDNCDDSEIVVTLISGEGSGGTFSVGTHEEVYSIADASGNTNFCTITITVEDTENPEVVCPTDQVIILDETDCTTIVNYILPTAIDNCPAVNVLHISGPLPGTEVPAGEHIVVFEAEDAAGNTTTCSFTITVVETVDPTITCPDDIVVYSAPGDCGAEVTYTEPTGEDNCPGALTNQTGGLGSGAFFPVGVHTETFTVTDLSGNTATCSFTITVLDTIAPTITCPADIELSADGGSCTAIVNYDMPTATDDCPGEVTVALVSGLPSGSEFPLGVTTIVISAVDASGNITTCSFTVTVEGESDLFITCPGDIVVSTDEDACGTIVEYPDPVVEDSCGGESTLTLEEGLPSGSFFPIGTTNIVYSASNEFGETASCVFTITVEDDVDPVFDCPEDIEVFIEDSDVCEIVVDFDTPNVTDNCGIASIELAQGNPSGSTIGVGTHVIGFIATDVNGNTATCSFNIVVIDLVDPTISNCPEDITIEATTGECGAIVNYDDPIGDDNCDFTMDVNDGLVSGSFFPIGTTTVTWTVTDVSGNTASCSFTVTVVDSTPPTVSCEDIVTCDPVVNWSVNAEDNCSVESIETVEGLPSGSEFPVGTTTVTVLVTDASGNTAECSFNVTVEENTNFADAGPDQVLCEGSETQLEANTPEDGIGFWTIVSGSGTLSDESDPNATISDLESGVTVLNWTVLGDGPCPSNADEVIITVEDDVIVDAGEDQTIAPGGSANLEATVSAEGGTISWSPESGLSCTDCYNPVATPTVTTTYTVTYTTENGCEYTDQVTVLIPFTEIPSGFTPDGDNVNDYWNLPNITDDMEVRIYNRWGNLIFESKGYRQPWDGTYNNKPLPTGSYYYVIDYKDGSEPVNGTITLIR